MFEECFTTFFFTLEIIGQCVGNSPSPAPTSIRPNTKDPSMRPTTYRPRLPGKIIHLQFFYFLHACVAQWSEHSTGN